MVDRRRAKQIQFALNPSRRPEMGEIATIGGNQDITRPFIDPLGRLLLPEDELLLLKGGTGWRRLEVYEQVRQNPQIFSCLQQRFSAVTQAEWDVLPGQRKGMEPTAQDEKAAEFIRDVLDNGFGKSSWDDVTHKMLWGVFYGYSVGECLWAKDGAYTVLNADRGGIRVRNRKRFQFDIDGDPKLITYTDSYGQTLPDKKFWVFSTGADHSDDPYGRGLAHWLYWLDWFQRNGMKFWLFFLEKWAQPTPWGKYPAGTSDADQDKLLETLGNIMTDAGVITPEGMEIELLEASRSGAADYDALYERMDEGISKVCLSQTMTTDDGSSLAQAKIHDKVADHVKKADADLINGSFNSGPVRWLIDFNRSVLGDCTYPQVWRKVEPEEDINSRAERDERLYALGYRLTPEKFEEIYGEGYELAPEPAPMPEEDASDAVDDEQDDPQGQNEDEFARRPSTADVMAQRLGREAQPHVAEMINRLSEMLEGSEDLVEFRQKIDRSFPDLGGDGLVDVLQQAMTAARFAGVYEAQEDADQ